MMRCPACSTVNERGRAYCGYCASSLGDICPVCQFFNGEGVRFCGGCARDLLAAVVAPAPVRAAAVGPAATAAAAALITPPDAQGDHGGFPCDLHDLADLADGLVPGGRAAESPSGAADTTQEEIDNFFQRLAREGAAEIQPPSASGQPPGPPRSTPS